MDEKYWINFQNNDLICRAATICISSEMHHSSGTSFHLPHLSDGRRFYSSRSEMQKESVFSGIHLIKHALGISFKVLRLIQ